jgi:hypothetical protein
MREDVELQEQISPSFHLKELYFTIPSFIEYAHAIFADCNENYLL